MLSLTRVGNEVTLGFVAKLAEGAGYAGMSRRYTVESSADLAAPWTPVPGYADIMGAGQTVLITIPAGPEKCFYRLKVGLE